MARNYDRLPFVIDGFKWLESEGGHGKVIYFNIIPSDALNEFRKELAEKVYKFAPDTKEIDLLPELFFI